MFFYEAVAFSSAKVFKAAVTGAAFAAGNHVAVRMTV